MRSAQTSDKLPASPALTWRWRPQSALWTQSAAWSRSAGRWARGTSPATHTGGWHAENRDTSGEKILHLIPGATHCMMPKWTCSAVYPQSSSRNLYRLDPGGEPAVFYRLNIIMESRRLSLWRTEEVLPRNSWGTGANEEHFRIHATLRADVRNVQFILVSLEGVVLPFQVRENICIFRTFTLMKTVFLTVSCCLFWRWRTHMRKIILCILIK